MKNYNDYWEEWLNECGEDEPDHEDDFSAGWHSCQETVLEILDKTEEYSGGVAFHSSVQSVHSGTDRITPC